jgi:Protein of unknwon function (DUF3310)
MTSHHVPIPDSERMIDEAIRRKREKRDPAVDHPDHYGGKDNPYEVIKVVEAWRLNFHRATAIIYMARAGKKQDELQDLKKARWYLDREIQNLEKHRDEQTSAADR